MTGVFGIRDEHFPQRRLGQAVRIAGQYAGGIGEHLRLVILLSQREIFVGGIELLAGLDPEDKSAFCSSIFWR